MQSPPTAPAVDADRPAPPFPPALVEEFLRQLERTVRARQLYPAGSPAAVGAVDKLRTALGAIWSHTDELGLTVGETAVRWFDVPVYQAGEKSSDSLPWLLFKDGLRELILLPGFETEELLQFLDILARVRVASADEDDLLTILWEHEFVALRYRYVDVGADASIPIVPGDEPGAWPASADSAPPADPREAIEEARREQAEMSSGPSKDRSGIVSMEDFDSTLYFLDENEIAFLREETRREYLLDLRREVLQILLDIFELQPDALVRQELVANLEALTLHLLSAQQFSTVAVLLREAASTVDRARDVDPALKERLARLPDRLSEPETLAQLLTAMDEAPQLPPAEDLQELFAQLRGTALETVLGWLAQLQNPQLRALVESAADRLAAQHTGEIVRLVSSSEGHVALEAIRRAGALRTAAAVPALGKVLNEPYRDLRLAAVTALQEIGSPGALQVLERAIEDVDRDIRVSTIRALAARVHKPALARVEAVLKGKELKQYDRTELVALFELYGALCGDAGVPWLDAMLSPKGGLFSRKEDPELRACAALALGRIGSAAAAAALQKAAQDKEAIVRTAVARALKRGDR